MSGFAGYCETCTTCVLCAEVQQDLADGKTVEPRMWKHCASLSHPRAWGTRPTEPQCLHLLLCYLSEQMLAWVEKFLIQFPVQLTTHGSPTVCQQVLSTGLVSVRMFCLLRLLGIKAKDLCLQLPDILVRGGRP